MKRLLLFLLPVLLASCSSKPVSDKITQLKEQYLPKYEASDISLIYFGNYNFYEVVFYYVKDFSYATAVHEVKIGDYTFIYPVINEIKAFGEQEYTLKKLYENNLISYENVGEIYGLYENNIEYFSLNKCTDVDLSK